MTIHHEIETFEHHGDQMVRLRRIPDGAFLGAFLPGCPTCDEERARIEETGKPDWSPSHHASVRCRSGSRPHCTCDACF